MNNISEAKEHSPRCLYALKRSIFSNWSKVCNDDLLSCDVASNLSFLQELLDVGRTPSTLKVNVAAIVAYHTPISG